MSELLNIIPDDGYTLEAYISEAPGIHSAVRFTYRPMLHSQRYPIAVALSEKPPVEGSSLMARAVAQFVQTWNITGAKSGEFAVSADNAARLKPALLEHIYAIVSGRVASDTDPDKPKETGEEDAALQAIVEGKAVGVLREEADAKN